MLPKKFKLIVLMALFLSLSQLAEAADHIPDYARQVIDGVKTTAEACGVSFVVAPPNRPTPADYLALSRDGRIIAHIIDRPGVFSAKNPLGGYHHWIEYDISAIGVYTPQGKVAYANRYTSGQVWEYNYYCRSVRVYPQQFDECIRQGFVQLLAQRLCNS